MVEIQKMMPQLLLITCTLALLINCSGEQRDEEKTSKIGKATDDMAHKMVENIQQPIDKAEAVKKLEEQRLDNIKKQTQQ